MTFSILILLSREQVISLIEDLQNGVYGTLADNDLKKLSEKDIQKGCPTTVYLNGKVIGHTAKNDNHHIIWDK